MKTLKKTFILMPLLVLSSFFNSFSAENPGDHIIGTWLTKDSKAKVQIYKQNDQYFGKIIVADDMYEPDGKTLKKDIKNDIPAKRNATIKNLIILKNFRYKGGIWTDGTIYDPEDGNSYSCKIKLKGSQLEIRGYIGISLFGRTEIWQKFIAIAASNQ